MSELKIPQGYKKTEIGVIPEDWACDSLESVCPKGRKYCIVDGPFGSNLKTEHYRKSGIPIITSGFVTDGTFQVDNYLFVDEEKFRQEKRSAVNPSDIVMAKIGARCGASAILPKEHVVGILSGNALKITVDESKHHTYFIWQLLWDLYTKGSLDDITTTGAQPAISMSSLKKYLIPLPPINEQTAIATALSDVDALICELEKIISKKQAIKTATMQQLLTGTTRLPQFSLRADGSKKGYKQSELGEIPEDWEVHSLGDLCNYQNGKAQEQYFNSNGGYKVVSIGNYSESGRYIDTGSYIDEKFKNEVGRFVLSRGDLAMILNDKTAIGTIIGRVLLIEADETYVMNQRTMRLAPKGSVKSKYLHFLLNSDSVHKRIVGMAKPGTQIYVNTDDVLGFNLLISNSQEEQTAIATILSDMEAEIQALEQRLGKTRQIKQGMMQELLTGKTRLVQPLHKESKYG